MSNPAVVPLVGDRHYNTHFLAEIDAGTRVLTATDRTILQRLIDAFLGNQDEGYVTYAEGLSDAALAQANVQAFLTELTPYSPVLETITSRFGTSERFLAAFDKERLATFYSPWAFTVDQETARAVFLLFSGITELYRASTYHNQSEHPWPMPDDEVFAPTVLESLAHYARLSGKHLSAVCHDLKTGDLENFRMGFVSYETAGLQTGVSFKEWRPARVTKNSVVAALTPGYGNTDNNFAGPAQELSETQNILAISINPPGAVGSGHAPLSVKSDGTRQRGSGGNGLSRFGEARSVFEVLAALMGDIANFETAVQTVRSDPSYKVPFLSAYHSMGHWTHCMVMVALDLYDRRGSLDVDQLIEQYATSIAVWREYEWHHDWRSKFPFSRSRPASFLTHHDREDLLALKELWKSPSFQTVYAHLLPKRDQQAIGKVAIAQMSDTAPSRKAAMKWLARVGLADTTVLSGVMDWVYRAKPEDAEGNSAIQSEMGKNTRWAISGYAATGAGDFTANKDGFGARALGITAEINWNMRQASFTTSNDEVVDPLQAINDMNAQAQLLKARGKNPKEYMRHVVVYMSPKHPHNAEQLDEALARLGGYIGDHLTIETVDEPVKHMIYGNRHRRDDIVIATGELFGPKRVDMAYGTTKSPQPR